MIRSRIIIGHRNRKGESSLISMVILVGLSILLSALILSYSEFEINERIKDFSDLKESTQSIELRIREARVENYNDVKVLLENNGNKDIDNVLIRVTGDKGMDLINADKIDSFSTILVSKEVNYENVGAITKIESIPYSETKKLIYKLSTDVTVDIKEIITDDKCRLDSDLDLVPDCVDLCIGNNCGPSPQCKIISASWSSSKTFGGLPIDIKINSANCEKNQVDIKIFEKDTFTSDDELDLLLYSIPNKVELNSNLVEYRIKIPYIFDKDGNNANPEYFFTVRLNDQIITSNILEIMDPRLSTINPKITSEKDTFNAFENPEFIFSYIDEEVYENLKVNETNNGTTFKNKWVDEFENIEFRVYDSDGILVLEELGITKIRTGKFEIKFNKKTELKPGQYRINVELNKNGLILEAEKVFNWGLIAINTDKSIYLENEKATIGMAVLDREGRVICDADILLEIIDPFGSSTILQGKDIIVSDECEVYGLITKPDYYTYYNVKEAGEYKINMSVIVNGTLLSINDSFFVQDNVDFDVRRDGPTRIYPLVEQMINISIRANTDYNGAIREFVPLDFNITTTNGNISQNNDRKIISWNVDLRKGDNIYLHYEFDSPDISPYLYLIGKLEIEDFEEKRYWQIAVDIPDRNRVEMVSPTSIVVCDPGQQFVMSCRMVWTQGQIPTDIQLRWQYSFGGQTWSLIPPLIDGLHMLYGFNTVDNAIVNTIYSKDVVCNTPAEYQVRCQAFRQSNGQTWNSPVRIVRVRGVDVIPSLALINGVNWLVSELPLSDLGAQGNNGLGATDFYVDIDTLYTNADLYLRYNAPLTLGGFIITDERYNLDWVDPTVPGALRTLIDGTYRPVITNNPDGRRIYFKFYLNVPGGQPPGNYVNNLQFKVVPTGSPPP